MWHFHNPVAVQFGQGALEHLNEALDGRRYAIVTYEHPHFAKLSADIMARHSGGQLVLNQVSENPDLADLPLICNAYAPHKHEVEVLVAIGGGSVIDTAKALAASKGEAERVRQILVGESQVIEPLPMIVLPTTTGTGSEVTCWATIWDKEHNRKFSLNHPSLYPETAICDPELTLSLPNSLTVQTGLDALSHAMESIWNHNCSPVTLNYAAKAIELIKSTLPELLLHPQDRELRDAMMQGSLLAGLAFSNTKTSIAHNISYGVTLDKGLPHGIACSFTLPTVLASFDGSDSETARRLRSLFGDDLALAAQQLESWINQLGVHTHPEDYGYSSNQWQSLVEDALLGERGKNFSGCAKQLLDSFC